MADRVTVHSFVGFSTPATVSAHPGLPVLSVLADPGETFVIGVNLNPLPE